MICVHLGVCRVSESCCSAPFEMGETAFCISLLGLLLPVNNNSFLDASLPSPPLFLIFSCHVFLCVSFYCLSHSSLQLYLLFIDLPVLFIQERSVGVFRLIRAPLQRFCYHLVGILSFSFNFVFWKKQTNKQTNNPFLPL